MPAYAWVVSLDWIRTWSASVITRRHIGPAIPQERVWAWFIQSTGKVTQADFELLIGQRQPGQKTAPGSAE